MLASDVPPDPAALAACRWNLARLVTTHLALEDKHVYLPLEAQRGTPASAVARRLRRELGDLYAAFQRHISEWPGEALVRDWAGYRRAADALLVALKGRIEREEADLYPLLAQIPRAVA